MSKKYELDMCNGPILSKLLRFTVPLMFSSILQLLFNAADIVVVGNWCGDNALAAVGSNTALINLLVNFFVGLSVGANVVCAHNIGSKNDENVSRTVHTAMALSIVSGIIITAIGCIFTRQILEWMSTPEKVLPLAATYLRIYFVGMTSTMIYNFGSAILRAVGDTKRPLYFLLAAGVINVLLNLLFVICFDLGVAGVAYATIISQTISAVLIVICLVRSEGSIRLKIKAIGINWKIFSKILKVGLPASFQGVIFSISNVIIQSSVNSFGETVLAGSSAAANIEGFVYMSMNAFHQATVSFTGQNMGAAKFDRIRKILITAEICVTVTGIIMGNAAYLLGDKLLYIYTDSSAVVAAGMDRLGVISRTYALCGMMDVLVGSLRGMGYAILPTIVSLVGICGVRLLWIFTFFRQPQFHTVISLYLTYTVSWIIVIIALVICYICAMRHVRKKYARRSLQS